MPNLSSLKRTPMFNNVGVIFTCNLTVFSISINPGIQHSFVSCGEDGSVRIWAGGDCVRELRLPVHSVWSVVCLENGDIVTGKFIAV